MSIACRQLALIFFSEEILLLKSVAKFVNWNHVEAAIFFCGWKACVFETELRFASSKG